MLDTLKSDYSAVVDEVTKAFSLGEIQKILQGLLKEQVSIRNLVAILETLGDFSSVSKDTGYLIEKTRQSLGRQICLQYADDEKRLQVLTIDPSVEKTIIDSRTETATGDIAALDPQFHRRWINAVANGVKAARGHRGMARDIVQRGRQTAGSVNDDEGNAGPRGDVRA
jgi:flagellar biosynthesis protein FlhA